MSLQIVHSRLLLQDNAEARAQAAALLPGGSLEPVVAAVERCLHFYITAGGLLGSHVLIRLLSLRCGVEFGVKHVSA